MTTVTDRRYWMDDEGSVDWRRYAESLADRVRELEEALLDAWSNHPSYRQSSTDRLALDIDDKRRLLGLEVDRG